MRLFGRLLKKRFVLLQPLWLFRLFDWLARVSVGHIQLSVKIRFNISRHSSSTFYENKLTLKTSLIAV
jgi:hypothetical protein